MLEGPIPATPKLLSRNGMSIHDKEVGLVTMCCGGGLGTGTLILRV